MCFVVTCWERADLLALVCGVFFEFVTFPLVSWVRCGTWLYRFLIFATLLLYFIDCCLYILYMYQWQNQHALPLVPGWILVPSDSWRWQEKLLCSVVTALTSKLCAALHGQSNVGSMCDCKPCWSLDVEILSGVVSDHGSGPRRNGSVKPRSTLCPIERRACLPKTLL